MLTNGDFVKLCNNSGEHIELLIRSCSAADLPSVLALQERVVKSLTAPHLFVPCTKDELTESLKLDYCIGAFSGDMLVAFSIMVRGRTGPRNLGTYLGYGNDRLLRCVTYDTAFVHPEYRGYGMQRLMNRIRDAEAIRTGAEEALATISPDNPVSLHNAQSCGFSVITEKLMYGGLPRYIVGKHFITRGG